MTILLILLGYYIIQIVFVLFLLVTTEAFESKKEFFFALTPFAVPYLIIKRISELK